MAITESSSFDVVLLNFYETVVDLIAETLLPLFGFSFLGGGNGISSTIFSVC